MKIPINWLKEYVDLKGLTDAEVSNALTMSGTENEIAGGVDFPKIVVGEVLKKEKHPNADRLNVTQTDVGKKNGGVRQIVCGAPNVEVGQKVPVALVGAQIGEFEIKEAELRGVKSQGMICSESELGISDEHSGIMVLDARAEVGKPLAEELNISGTVLEAEITPNRSDCFSMIGVAREAAAALDRKLTLKKIEKAEIKSKKVVKVEVFEKELCPRYILKVVEGIKIGPSPKWMQDRLAAAGVRPVNNVVDVTNYVMLEFGQPMHAFDAAKVSGKIIVRRAKEGEKLITLDGVERKLKKTDLVNADSKKAIGLAGVMGGLNSEVTEKTKAVVLEAAVFDRTSVRKTAQRLALRSEASNRFEKGIPLGLPEIAIERAAKLLTEIPGGLAGKMPVVKPAAGANTDVLTSWIWKQHVGLSVSELNKFLGVEIKAEDAVKILKSLGFEAEKFDIKKEARRHVGKPYIWGASYKTHGDMAFDCSYLTDYIYSKIGKFIGYVCLGQFELGTPVNEKELQPGDIVFVRGLIKHSPTKEYFVPDGKGGYEKRLPILGKEVGHQAIYIGNGRVINARQYQFDFKQGKWVKASKQGVVEEDLEVFTKNPEYLGARRYIENPEDWIAVDVPWWRLDVSIQEDLFEEIGRIYGYENLPSTLPKGELPRFQVNVAQEMVSKIKDVLVGAGFYEVYNYSFISEKGLKLVGEDPKKSLRVANPLTPENEYMRTTLIPSLLEDIRINQDNFEEVSVFEVASSYIPDKNLAKETYTLGLAVKSKGKKAATAFFALKGALELVAGKLNLGNLTVKKTDKQFLAIGQAALIYINGTEVGYLGMTSDKLAHEADLKTAVAVAEINLENLSKLFGKSVVYIPVSKYPTVTRDINLLFEKETSIQEVNEALEKLSDKNIKTISVMDIFEGAELPEGTKSVTIRLVMSSSEKTLTEEEVTETQTKIINILKKQLKAKERY